MLSKKYINKCLTKNFEEITINDYLLMHICLESYIKHIFFVTIRKRGGIYKKSEIVIRKANISFNEKNLQKSILLLIKGENKNSEWTKIKKKDKRFEKLVSLIFTYALPIRNILFHGSHYSFNNELNELKFLYKLYIDFINIIENLIFSKTQCTILNNKPREFGAKKGTVSDRVSILNMVELHGSKEKGVIKFEEAKSIYDQIK